MPGLDQQVIDEIDWDNAISNIRLDSRSDFILSPHFDIIYLKNPDRFRDSTIQSLRIGSYNPRLPVTFSVPKSNFLTRPGSILEPRDRLIHQALLEQCIEPIENQIDRSRTFSQVPSQREDEIFEPSHLGWERYQRAVTGLCQSHAYVLKADITNYFETIPQHNIINLLSASGARPEIVNLIEEQLLAFRQRSSTGIIQGIFPSDVLGNFYLSDFDGDCELHGLMSARYVDDIFVGFENELQARKELVRLTERLRQNGLHFNAQKTTIAQADTVIFEEREIDRLFDEARNEIEDTIEFLRLSGYGFQGDWINEDEEIDEQNVQLEAVRYLYSLEEVTEQQREKIDRFCLPILRGADDNFAVDRVIDSFSQRPHLTRIYASYLTHFTRREPEIVHKISDMLIRDEFFCDYQRMYMLASILNCDSVTAPVVTRCLRWLESPVIGLETRAICAIFAAKFGSALQKRTVRVRYENEQSEYVRSAILYSAQYFPTAERRSAKRAWGSQSDLNAQISAAI